MSEGDEDRGFGSLVAAREVVGEVSNEGILVINLYFINTQAHRIGIGASQ